MLARRLFGTGSPARKLSINLQISFLPFVSYHILLKRSLRLHSFLTTIIPIITTEQNLKILLLQRSCQTRTHDQSPTNIIICSKILLQPKRREQTRPQRFRRQYNRSLRALHLSQCRSFDESIQCRGHQSGPSHGQCGSSERGFEEHGGHSVRLCSFGSDPSIQYRPYHTKKCRHRYLHRGNRESLSRHFGHHPLRQEKRCSEPYRLEYCQSISYTDLREYVGCGGCAGGIVEFEDAHSEYAEGGGEPCLWLGGE
mmetsp:Transcript_29837/g.64318  ORF Transcript_29837/g.64318 Transcript_29837/m.64318 type:complete len:255 (+) Transcript_29837:1686-2450(+)